MRKLLSFHASIIIIQLLSAQNVAVPAHAPPPVYLRDLFTTPVEPKKYAAIQGSPFLDDNWMLARLTLSKFKVVDSILVRLNLYERRLHFLDEKNEEMQAAIDFEQINIIDRNSKWYNSVFLPGIGHDKESFVQIIADGDKIKLVKKLTVTLWEIKALNAETQKKFEQEEKLCLFANNILYKTGKSCSSVFDAFGNNSDVQKFISANNIHCNKEEELKKAVDYFNSLR
jgi:hypothetical protein